MVSDKYLPLVALFCFLQHLDAAITDWTVPSINGSADGSGVIFVSEDQTTWFIFDDINAVSDTAAGATHCCSYTYVTQAYPFSILTDGGVQVTSTLDYETTQSYVVVVEAEDSVGGLGTVTVTFLVTDVNEATPVFAELTYSACASNGSEADSVVTTVQATDQDTSQQVSYSLTGGNTNSDFKIEANTGEIKVNTGKTLDKAETAAYSLIVEATDDGSPPLTGTATVSLTVGDCSSATHATASFAAIFVFFLIQAYFVFQ